MKYLVSEEVYRKLYEATYRPLKKPVDAALMTWEEYFKHNNKTEVIDASIESEAITYFNDFEFEDDDFTNDLSVDYVKVQYFYDSLTNEFFVRYDIDKNEFEDVKRLVEDSAEIKFVDNVVPRMADRFTGLGHDWLIHPDSNKLLQQKLQRTIRGLFFQLTLLEDVKGKEMLAVFNVVNSKRIAVAVTTLYKTGTLITEVAADYGGYGLGKWLAETMRNYKNSVKSGAQSLGGYKMLKKIHTDAVRNYLSSGIYSYLLRGNKISKERINDIIRSAKAPLEIS